MHAIIRVILFFVVTALLLAQVYTGTLTGVVTDPSGAIVPNAAVMLTDQEKGFPYSGTTDSEGRFVLRNLPPSKYRLNVNAPGMQPYSQSDLTLTVGQNAQINVQLQVQGSV